jgi:D-3-phosphoglycerate dehydrogenase
MKILIADSIPQPHADKLASNGHILTLDPSLDGDSLVDAIADHEILIVRSTRVTDATLSAATALKIVIRAGAGTNTIDKTRAAELDIRVCNVPGANAVAVAELVMGLIISIDRHIADNVYDLRNQVWNKKRYSVARGLYGQNMGILGLGAIGLAVAERARAFGMNLYSVAKQGRSETQAKRIEEAGITLQESQQAVLETCDVITLHMPATGESTILVNADFLGQMKEGAILINTARGELIDESALIAAMDSRGIRAGLDVYNNEPRAGENTFNSTLARHPRVCGTHHIGASTDQAQAAVSDGVLDVIESFQDGNLIYCVN